MNALIHVCGLAAAVWLAFFTFQTLGNVTMGIAALGLVFLMLALTIFAAIQDFENAPGRRQ